MTTNFIPDIGDRYCFATYRKIYTLRWGADSADIDIAKNMGVFPYTPYGRKLAALQHALMVETSMFLEWVDDYDLDS